jgi:hypothetical protein
MLLMLHFLFFFKHHVDVFRRNQRLRTVSVHNPGVSFLSTATASSGKREPFSAIQSTAV